MRFVVYGAGAIGGVVGARLFQQGHDVVLIARGAHYEAIRERGLRIQSPDDDATLAIPVVDHPSQLAFTPDDVVFLAMKSQGTIAACEALDGCAIRVTRPRDGGADAVRSTRRPVDRRVGPCTRP